MGRAAVIATDIKQNANEIVACCLYRIADTDVTAWCRGIDFRCWFRLGRLLSHVGLERRDLLDYQILRFLIELFITLVECAIHLWVCDINLIAELLVGFLDALAYEFNVTGEFD